MLICAAPSLVLARKVFLWGTAVSRFIARDFASARRPPRPRTPSDTNSSGLNVLVQGKKRIHEVGSRIALIVSPQVRRILELMFPEHLFAARVDTMEQAREALGWD